MGKIKRFFICNVVLSFILIGSLYSLSWIWVRHVNEQTMRFLELENNKINNLKIINIGSSHTMYGIKYPRELMAYNLGLLDQMYDYDLKILKKFSNKFDKECIIIIPVSIFSFTGGLKSNIYSYIHFLDKKDFLKMDKKEYILNKYFSITQPIKNIFKMLRYLSSFVENKKIYKKYINYPQNLSLKERQREAVYTKKLHLGLIHKEEVFENDFGMNQLKEILKFCENNNFNPILVSTPQTYLYNEEIGEKNYQERIYNNILEVEKQLGKKYLYLDYSHDKKFENNLEYFFDDDHLNEKGAEYFTEILLNDIKSHGYNFE